MYILCFSLIATFFSLIITDIKSISHICTLHQFLFVILFSNVLYKRGESAFNRINLIQMNFMSILHV